MKTTALLIAASAALALAAPGLASAQPSAPAVTGYGYLGYAGTSADGFDLGSIQGRLGARFGSFLGIEGELAGGVKTDDNSIGGLNVHTKLRHQEAAYGVGFIPLSPNFDLIGRVGYGHTDFKATGSGFAEAGGVNSWNYGAGAQYLFDGRNGVRADYTRESFEHNRGDADVWAVGYVRKF